MIKKLPVYVEGENMDVFVSICLIISIVVFTIYKIRLFKNKKNDNKFETKKEYDMEKEVFFPAIQVIENNDLIPSKNSLITNEQAKSALATIDNLIPRVVSTSKNIKNVKELSKKGKVFFSANEQDVKNMMSAGKNMYYGTQVSSKTKKLQNKRKLQKKLHLLKI